jgi:anti-sigma B factor antagonist
MQIRFRKASDVVIIEAEGALRLGDAVDKLREALESLIASGDPKIVVDASRIPMIDSSGIGVLVRTLTVAKQRGGSVKLVQPSKEAIRTMKLVGLLSLFEIFDDEDSAIASFAAKKEEEEPVQ